MSGKAAQRVRPNRRPRRVGREDQIRVIDTTTWRRPGRAMQVLAAAVVACAAVLTAATPAAAQVPPPSNGAYHAAFTPGGHNNFEQKANKNIAIEMDYHSWQQSNFPTNRYNTVYSRGAVPHMTWEAFAGYSSGILQRIINGQFDNYIRRWARQVRNWGKPIMIRWGHEMNGNWYPWSGAKNGGGATGGFGNSNKADGPERYIAAYRHIHDIFDQKGANNVSWIWCPNRNSVPANGWNQAQKYYPGAAYVDWIGVDGYNFGTTRNYSSWSSFVDLFSAPYNQFDGYGKPMMIGEFASAEVGGDKGGWIQTTFFKIRTAYPKIKAVTWFDINKEADWRINSSTRARNKYRTAVGRSYFKTRVPIGFGIGPTVSPGGGKIPIEVKFRAHVDGGWGPYQYQWDFGDGAHSQGPNPTHIYRQPGKYPPKLTVTDVMGRTRSKTLHVTTYGPPGVDPNADPSVGRPPLTVSFLPHLNPSGTRPYEWSWTFGDGGTSSKRQPTHTYKKPGDYNAKITVTDDHGLKASGTVEVSVKSNWTLAASAIPRRGGAPLTVEFRANPSGIAASKLNFKWNFGDANATANDRRGVHTYVDPGDYKARVTATDENGRTVKKSVTIAAKPPGSSGPPDTGGSGQPDGGPTGEQPDGGPTGERPDAAGPGDTGISNDAAGYADGGPDTDRPKLTANSDEGCSTLAAHGRSPMTLAWLWILAVVGVAAARDFTEPRGNDN